MKHRKNQNKFQIKQLETFKVIRLNETFDSSESNYLNINDPRLDRPDGGRTRPVYYDNGKMSFSPR
jgi:hypothetical protein